jgi:hypothetical protein
MKTADASGVTQGGIVQPLPLARQQRMNDLQALRVAPDAPPHNYTSMVGQPNIPLQ